MTVVWCGVDNTVDLQQKMLSLRVDSVANLGAVCAGVCVCGCGVCVCVCVQGEGLHLVKKSSG